MHCELLKQHFETNRKLQKNQGAILQHNIDRTAAIETAYVGYTVQQYVSKRTGTQVRSVAAYDQFRFQIPDRAQELLKFVAPTVEIPELGIVPNMFSMIPLAQGAHAPIRDLRPQDGVRGAQVTQQANYSEQLGEIGKALIANAGLREPGEH